MTALPHPTRLAAAIVLALAGAAHAGTAPTTLDALPRAAGWQQLSAQEKDVVRGSYERLGADDEPPYPVGGLAGILEPLDQAAGHIRAEGMVDAIVEVGADGRATSVSVFRSPEPNLFTPLVSRLLMRQAWKPAQCHGQPCAMPFALRVRVPH